jgi:hypothetical protein
MASRQEAESTLVEYAGISKEAAKDVVNAVIAAAKEEALELIAGSAPVPTNMGDARALRLRYISQARQQSLSQREVGVIFRLGPTQAAGTIDRMQATYAQEVDGLFRARLAEAASVEKTGSMGNYRYSVHFDDKASFEYAHQFLQRSHVDHDVRRKPNQTLDMPRKIKDQHGQERDPLDVLGIPIPK